MADRHARDSLKAAGVDLSRGVDCGQPGIGGCTSAAGVRIMKGCAVAIMRHVSAAAQSRMLDSTIYGRQARQGADMRLILPASGFAAALLLGGCVVSPYDGQQGAYPEYQADSATQPVDYGGSADEVNQPPPPLQEDDQPPCPVDGYIWTPGVWRWGAGGYFWVPGTWVAPPSVGLLWTPGYWALSGAVYVFHAGYWGPRVGFYGGVNYGHGYGGDGYEGGRWVNNNFQYNRSVSNVNTTVVSNVYNKTVVNNITMNRVSYAGGPGTRLAPNPREMAVAHDARVAPTVAQVQHQAQARGNPQFAAHDNATGRPYQPPQAAQHARDLPQPQVQPQNREPARGGNPLSELQARQEQERQTLSMQQEQEHRAFARQPDHSPQAYQAMEQRHQQQTQQLQQRHQQERQSVNHPQGHDERGDQRN